ncbi:hypothetical protein HAX54_025887 [Datura stramonium]|uniref:Uncharacterized protein n=1 Tax=Datura stramonium TaxID=4076 RepID=A0ABS8V0H7_DATST|nr:hypothetical protein [Datura stramonium]
MFQVWKNGSLDKRLSPLKGRTEKNSKKQQQLASKAFKKAMKVTWGETSDEESKVEDGGNDNLALMAKSDTDSDNDSSEVSLSNLKSQIHNLSKRKVVKLLLSLMDECQQMSAEKMEMSKIFSNLKSDYKVLKKEKIEYENTIKTLNVVIKNLEETVSVQKTENSKLMGTVSSLKAELDTIKERKTSSTEISNYDQDLEPVLAIRTNLSNAIEKENMLVRQNINFVAIVDILDMLDMNVYPGLKLLKKMVTRLDGLGKI